MTIFGKILTFLVLLLAVAGMWLIANAYAARVNWKARADSYEKGYKDAVAARDREYTGYLSERDSLNRRAESQAKELEAKTAENATLVAAIKTAREDLDKAVARFTGYDIQVNQLQATVTQNLDELTGARKRIATLENDRVDLVIRREQAERDRLAAKNRGDLIEQINADLNRRVEDLVAKVNELRQTGGGDPRLAVLRSVERTPTPVPENFRGTITAVKDDFVELSLGIDAGLGEGSALDAYRLTPEGKYLGTIVVKTVYPKKAVGVFKAANGRPTDRLRPDEKPKPGDLIRPEVNRASFR